MQQLIDVSFEPRALKARVDNVVNLAKWASESFAKFDRTQTLRIAEAVARAAHEHAAEYADWAVKETGFGRVEDKILKNEGCSLSLFEHYKSHDFISPRIDEAKKIVELPRPAGVIYALSPSTNPVCTIYFKAIIALLTRNSIIFSPHPRAVECCISAAKMLAAAAEAAGAPKGLIQVVTEAKLPMIDEFMRSEKIDLILATGGNAMVRAAYSSANPAVGVGPGNVPVLVHESADLDKAVAYICESKSFDNSLLCPNESCVIVEHKLVAALQQAFTRAGAHVCQPQEVAALRDYLITDHGFNVDAIGRDACWIAQQAGIQVANTTRILVTPIDRIGIEEPLSKEKLCPVLSMVSCENLTQSLSLARAMLRLQGAGHTAVIHAHDPRVIMQFSAQVEVYRVVVNAPSSQGSAGFATHLPPSYTIGTGFFGRSSVGENVGPTHLVNWTRIAYNKDPKEVFDDFTGIDPISLRGQEHHVAFNRPLSASVQTDDNSIAQESAQIRAQIRSIIQDELRDILKE
ncbi:MAG: aldehyde dehydrogenase family protein [Pseudomonadales bacterium]